MISGEKLHRVTFARSVAQRIADLSGPMFHVEQVELKRGRELGVGEYSKALYGIYSRAKDKLLRVCIQPEVAAILGDDPSRGICEVWLSP